MARYSYKVRDSHGVQKQGLLVAADRGSAIRSLTEQGLIVISVSEVSEDTERRTRWLKSSSIALVALVSLSGFLLCIRAFVQRRPLDEGTKQRVSDLRTATNVIVQSMTRTNPVKIAEATTIPMETVSTPSTPVPRVEAKLVQKIGPSPLRKPVYGIVKSEEQKNVPDPLSTLKTTTERAMSQLLKVRPGDMYLEIPLSQEFAADFAAALTNVIVIYDTDSEKDAEHKTNIAWMKEELRKMAAAGESPEAILLEYRKQLKDLAAYRQGLQRQLNEIKRSGTREEAELFAREANKMLEPYGARPLTVAPVVSGHLKKEKQQ